MVGQHTERRGRYQEAATKKKGRDLRRGP